MRVWFSPRRPTGTLFSYTLGMRRGHLDLNSASYRSLSNTGWGRAALSEEGGEEEEAAAAAAAAVGSSLASLSQETGARHSARERSREKDDDGHLLLLLLLHLSLLWEA